MDKLRQSPAEKLLQVQVKPVEKECLDRVFKYLCKCGQPNFLCSGAGPEEGIGEHEQDRAQGSGEGADPPRRQAFEAGGEPDDLGGGRRPRRLRQRKGVRDDVSRRRRERRVGTSAAFQTKRASSRESCSTWCSS